MHCISIWNYVLSHKKMDGDAVREKLAEGRMHVKCCCRMYRRRIRRGKFLLQGQSTAAMNWSEETNGNLSTRSSTFLVKVDQCAYGLLTPSEPDP